MQYITFPLLLLSYFSQSVVNYSYYHYYELTDITILLIMAIMPLSLFGWWLNKYHNQIFVFITYVVITVITTSFFFTKNLEIDKYKYIFSFLIFLFLFYYKKNINIKLLLAGVVLSSYSTLLFAQFYAVKVDLKEGVSNVLNFSSSNVDNIVVILFDELDYSLLSDTFVEIEGDRKVLYSGERAGINTADAIPNIFFKNKIKSVRPCAPSIICDKNKILDFNLATKGGSINNGNLFARGFYFPICSFIEQNCSVKNLSSGVFDAILCKFWPASSFGLDACLNKGAYLKREASDVFNESRGWLNKNKYNNQTKIVYIHSPLPHPPGTSRTGKINDDIDLWKSEVVEEINKYVAQLQSRKYLVAIMSDHPFRKSIWCNSKIFYLNDNCSDLAVDGNNIPLSIITNLTGNIKSFSTVDEFFESIFLLLSANK